YSLFKYQVFLFKLINRPTTFQQFINEILIKYLDKFVTVYINNILIYSNNIVKYKLHIYLILKKL
ncbi:uncharacterized protein BO80DRAFT_346189, partial [Aspergillus ibericus CBS 121593]